MKRLIVGCGYLGRRVAERWRDQGDRVFAVTRSPVTAEHFRRSGLEPIVADVTVRESLDAFPECDTVLHAVGYDRSGAASKREVYVEGLTSVLTVLRDRCSRFLHVSSTSVYGHDAGESVDETSVCEAAHESGVICRDAEQAVSRVLTETSAAWVVLRLSGLYGPDRLLSRIEAVRNRQPLPGSPDAWLNLIHVDDAARAVIAAAELAEIPPLLLISDDRPVQRGEYYGMLARLLEAPAPLFDLEAAARHSRGSGKRCVNRLAREVLGLTLDFPTINEGLPDALRRTPMREST